jgi:hypothetical protein
MYKGTHAILLSISTFTTVSLLTSGTNALPSEQRASLVPKDILNNHITTSPVFWILVALCPTILVTVWWCIHYHKDRENILYKFRYGEIKPNEGELSQCWEDRGTKVNVNEVWVPAAVSQEELWVFWGVHGMRYREDRARIEK